MRAMGEECMDLCCFSFLFFPRRKQRYESPGITLKLAGMGVYIHYRLLQFMHHITSRGETIISGCMLGRCCNGRGRKLMQANRIFHHRLLGLQSASCDEDESYNSEAAGRSFVLQ